MATHDELIINYQRAYLSHRLARAEYIRLLIKSPTCFGKNPRIVFNALFPNDQSTGYLRKVRWDYANTVFQKNANDIANWWNRGINTRTALHKYNTTQKQYNLSRRELNKFRKQKKMPLIPETLMDNLYSHSLQS